MRITRADLDAAVEAELISTGQAHALWAFLARQQQDQPGFRLAHVLYYLGGLVAIAAMTLFVTLGWEQLGGWGIFAVALIYMALGVGLAEYLQARRLTLPTGLIGALVVALTPLAVYGLQRGLGVWGEGDYWDYHRVVSWRWLFMELATLAVGAVVLWRYRVGFLVMPVAATLWYLSMDLAPFIADGGLTWELRRDVSLWFGLAMVLLALAVDLRSGRRPDYAFWLYLFGLAAFWGGLTFRESDSELARAVYCLLNLGLVLLGAMLRRRAFAVFGALGVAVYLGHLAGEVFQDSLWFSLVLSLVGLCIIYLGVVWQSHEATVGERLRARLPARLRAVVEQGE